MKKHSAVKMVEGMSEGLCVTRLTMLKTIMKEPAHRDKIAGKEWEKQKKMKRDGKEDIEEKVERNWRK